jgi:P2 family phage contractile tail tube protein
LGIAPRILIAPEFCLEEVVAEMIPIAERLRSVVVLEMEFTFAEYDAEILKLCGLTNGSEVAFTVRGAVQGAGDPESVVINVRGFFREFDFDTWKAAEKSTFKCSVACSYYKLSMGGVELIEIDPINMIRNVNGGR